MHEVEGESQNSIQVDWWDTARGVWADMGEAYNLEAAKARIAGLLARDEEAGVVGRYRYVQVHSKVYTNG